MADDPDLGDDVRAALRGGGDPVARSVARARLARELFARDHPVRLGRYQLLDRVGAGGMGAVWGAWDPELERRVAIKLLHPELADRDRILREGQALARLAHPNVIAIFDVSAVDDQVYLVMEWVRGATLRAFAASATAARLVDAYRQACAGLAAAHRAGVIHRDFKPDNAVVGDDGRVRVLDFGLAIDDAAAGDAPAAGTPRYMAPEQAAGAAVTAAIDQFAFCVSLDEAFAAIGRPPPRWIAAIIARGTASDPAARFASMTELAGALADDPARRWRRRGIAAAAVAGLATAFAIGRIPQAASRCQGAADAIARSWSAAPRAAMVDHLRGLGPFGAHEADRIAGELDDYARRWIAARTDACRAYDGGELPAPQYDLRVGCLARAEAVLAAAAEVMTGATSDQLPGALIAARSLPSTAACADEDAARVAPPADAVAAQVTEAGRQVERARLLAVAASPRAADVAAAATATATATGYSPVIARALAAQGWAHRTADRPRAIDLLQRAFHTAVRTGDDALAVETYARARFIASRAVDFAPVRGESDLVEALGVRSGRAGRFGLALLYNNLATERIVADDRAGARALLRRALATWQPPLGDRAHDLELIVVLRNLALVEDSPARRLELSRRAADDSVRELGADHPAAINARIQLAVLTADPAAAAATFAQTCPAIPAWHAALRRDCSYEAGLLAIDRGDLAGAAAAMTTARGDAGEPRPQQRIAAAYVELGAGDPARVDAAIADLRALATSLAADTGWWTHADAGDALTVAALGDAARGRLDASTAAWSGALALYADQPALERRRARAHAVLAERLAARSPDDARDHARAAAAWYLAVGGYPAELAALQPLAATQTVTAPEAVRSR